MMSSSKPWVIAVAGGSGSGKSWLCARWESEFSNHVSVLNLDRFYRDRPYLSFIQKCRVNYDHPQALEWGWIESCLDSLVVGEAQALPLYDYATHSRQGSQTFIPARVVVVEGLWPFRSPRLRSRYQWRIYLDGPPEIRLSQRMGRDRHQRNRNFRETKQRFESVVEPCHARYVEPQRKWADDVVSIPISDLDYRRITGKLRCFVEGDRLQPIL